MRPLLYMIAFVLIIGWVLGAYVYNAGALIHILLAMAVISLLLSLTKITAAD